MGGKGYGEARGEKCGNETGGIGPSIPGTNGGLRDRLGVEERAAWACRAAKALGWPAGMGRCSGEARRGLETGVNPGAEVVVVVWVRKCPIKSSLDENLRPQQSLPCIQLQTNGEVEEALEVLVETAEDDDTVDDTLEAVGNEVGNGRLTPGPKWGGGGKMGSPVRAIALR